MPDPQLTIVKEEPLSIVKSEPLGGGPPPAPSQPIREGFWLNAAGNRRIYQSAVTPEIGQRIAQEGNWTWHPVAGQDASLNRPDYDVATNLPFIGNLSPEGVLIPMQAGRMVVGAMTKAATGGAGAVGTAMAGARESVGQAMPYVKYELIKTGLEKVPYMPSPVAALIAAGLTGYTEGKGGKVGQAAAAEAQAAKDAAAAARAQAAVEAKAAAATARSEAAMARTKTSAELRAQAAATKAEREAAAAKAAQDARMAALDKKAELDAAKLKQATEAKAAADAAKAERDAAAAAAKAKADAEKIKLATESKLQVMAAKPKPAATPAPDVMAPPTTAATTATATTPAATAAPEVMAPPATSAAPVAGKPVDLVLNKPTPEQIALRQSQGFVQVGPTRPDGSVFMQRPAAGAAATTGAAPEVMATSTTPQPVVEPPPPVTKPTPKPKKAGAKPAAEAPKSEPVTEAAPKATALTAEQEQQVEDFFNRGGTLDEIKASMRANGVSDAEAEALLHRLHDAWLKKAIPAAPAPAEAAPATTPKPKRGSKAAKAAAPPAPDVMAPTTPTTATAVEAPPVAEVPWDPAVDMPKAVELINKGMSPEDAVATVKMMKRQGLPSDAEVAARSAELDAANKERAARRARAAARKKE